MSIFLNPVIYITFSSFPDSKKNSHDELKNNRSDGSKASVVRFAMLPPQGAAV